ncbi:MAG: helix-turn-helix transcriptional regulator [Lachnospiraceae bacterium]|nr:helix-turn-helix transcriptional regulator [Lachnospiraceae bacterium]
MFYYFEFTSNPKIQRNYTVTRNTIWEITEQEHLLIFIVEGFCQFSYRGETRIVHQGDVVYIPANQSYVRKSVDNTLCTMTYIHFLTADAVTEASAQELGRHVAEQRKLLDNYILSSNAKAITAQPSYIYLQTFYTEANTEKLSEQLGIINSLSTKRLLMTNLLFSASLCNILALLSQHTIDKVISNVKLYDMPEIPSKLKRAISYITMHYSEQITLEDLANHCSISKQQLIRYFNNAFHTTPVNYITDFKLSRAKELLFYHPDISIKEIAAELGFDNQHYFSRVFTKKNGETPSQYRNRTVNFKEPEMGMHQKK